MRISRFICSIIFVFGIFISFCFAECNHNFNINLDDIGNHYRECSLCDFKENTSIHKAKSNWSFDNDGKYHFKECNVNGCLFEYEKSEHIDGSHNNNGVCSVCGGIYQTHEFDAENVKHDTSYHWYICSYEGCKEAYDEKPHIKSSEINSDLESHWFKCELVDCNYKFEEKDHYGGESNNGCCAYELCEKLYKAKLEIDKYEFRKYEVGDKDKLIAKIIPEGIEVPKAEFKWYSSMPSVVKVDKEGNIEAKHNGIANIYATYGDFYASCVVVVGDLTFDITPKSHKVYVNEIATSSINVTYKENKKSININEYVDFSVFKWTRDSLKADIRTVTHNKANFIGINKTDEPVTFYMWLDNRVRVIDDNINKNIFEKDKISKNDFIKLKENLEEVLDAINKKDYAIEIKNNLEDILNKIKDDEEYTDEEINDLYKGIIKVKENISEFNCEIKVEVMLKDILIPEISPSSSGNYPVTSPSVSLKPTQSSGEVSGENNTPQKTPGQDSNNQSGESSGNQGNTDKPITTSSSPKVTPTIQGPGHAPKPPSNTISSNVINRKHTCSTLSYLPNPEDPEKGHMKRCYSSDCEFYRKGILETEQEHDYKFFNDKNVTVCIVCRYEKGSGVLEPTIVHSRDFGIDIMQSQYIIVNGETTEIDINITGIESDVAIHYGAKDETLKTTVGRNDENSIYLKWDVKEKYAKEALKIDFKKTENKNVMSLELKENYNQAVTSEIDLILENKFGEKRIETIEIIKEAPERAQFVLRFSSDIISSIKVGDTKDISVLCKSMYGYGSSDKKEVQEYYKSKNLVDYEDIKLEWKSTGGITVTGENTPNSEGYAKGTITGVSSTQNGEKAEIIVIATAKYENGDLIDEVERELKRGISVYIPNNNSTNSNHHSSSSSSSNSNQQTTTNQNNNAGSGRTLPIAAGVVGLVAIALVVAVVSKSTKG